MTVTVEKPKHLGFLLLQAFYILVSIPLLVSPVLLLQPNWLRTSGSGASLSEQILGFALIILGIGTAGIAVGLARFTYKSLRLSYFLSIVFILGNLIWLIWNVQNLTSGTYVDSPRQAIIQPTILIIVGVITIWFIQNNLRKFTVK